MVGIALGFAVTPTLGHVDGVAALGAGAVAAEDAAGR
jgi:hypothetical protein